MYTYMQIMAFLGYSSFKFGRESLFSKRDDVTCFSLDSIRNQQEQMTEQMAAIEARIKESEKSHSELTPKLSALHT